MVDILFIIHEVKKMLVAILLLAVAILFSRFSLKILPTN